jgi:hypothetical protein
MFGHVEKVVYSEILTSQCQGCPMLKARKPTLIEHDLLRGPLCYGQLLNRVFSKYGVQDGWLTFETIVLANKH